MFLKLFRDFYEQEKQAQNGGTSRKKGAAAIDDDGTSSESSDDEDDPRRPLSYRTPFLTQASRSNSSLSTQKRIHFISCTLKLARNFAP